MNTKTVWKYGVHTAPVQEIYIPEFATPLCLMQQKGKMFMWCEVDKTRRRHYRQLFVVMTGAEVPAEAHEYVGTFQMLDGDLVFHVYLDAGVHDDTTLHNIGERGA